MESNCRRCHDGVMKLDYGVDSETDEPVDYAPNLTKGLALFEDPRLPRLPRCRRL